MVQLAGWLAVSFALAWIGRSRPIHLVCLALLLWSVVPAVAGHIITGLSPGPMAFHPATWLLLCIVAVQVVTNPSAMSQALARHIYLVLGLSLFVVGAAITSYATGSGGFRLLFDQAVGPMLLFWVVVAFAPGHKDRILLLRNTLLLAVAVQCALALVQRLAGSILLYQSDYERLYWFNPAKFDRWMGTTDSPLVLSLAIGVASALTVSLQRNSVRLGLMVLFLAGSLVIQSRTGIVTIGLVVLFIVVRSRMALWARVLYSLLIVAAGYLLLTSSLVTGLTQRIADDLGSADARIRAVNLFASRWLDFFLVGGGLTSSYDFGRGSGLRTSLESSYLMYAVDTGIVLASIYFGAQLWLIIRHLVRPGLPGLGIAALVGFGLQNMFSGVAASNLTGIVVWAAIAMLVASTTLAADLAPHPGEIKARRPRRPRQQNRTSGVEPAMVTRGSQSSDPPELIRTRMSSVE